MMMTGDDVDDYADIGNLLMEVMKGRLIGSAVLYYDGVFWIIMSYYEHFYYYCCYDGGNAEVMMDYDTKFDYDYDNFL